MPKCRPNLDNASDHIPTELKVPGNCRKAVESGEATGSYWSRQYGGGTLGVDSGKQAFDRHAALLDDSRPDRSATRIQRAIIVRKLQRDHGTRYVQRLIEYISRRRATQVRAKITAGPVSDKKFAE